MRRVVKCWLIGLLFTGSVLAGCSDAPLSKVGHLTERWIAAAPESTAPSPTVFSPVPLGLLAAEADRTIQWSNDELGNPITAVPEETVAAVWLRGNGQDRYVQASRSEIAIALPGIEFPTLIPENVAFVTSQLVFDPNTGELSSDVVAAFGFWSVKPYSKSRSVAQLALLLVSTAQTPIEPVVTDTIGVPESPPGALRCDDLAAGTVRDCHMITLSDGSRAWALDVTDGWRIVWSPRRYEYDLFVRDAADADLPARMADSCEELIPVISVVAGADVAEGTPAGIATEDPVGASGS